jgi:hypothetical protein
MASRKQIPQPRLCAQCGTTFYSARKGHVHCSGACNTRAWRARQASTPQSAQAAEQRAETSALRAPAAPVLPLESALVPTTDAAASPATQPLGFSKTVAATVVGNYISDKLTEYLGPKEASTSLPPSGWPTWPPAELLATTAPPLLLREPNWVAPLLLTPVTYRQHRFYLCLDQGLTVVLYQRATGEWLRVYTPAELAQLSAQPPQSADRLRVLQTKYAATAPDQAASSASLQAPAFPSPS